MSGWEELGPELWITQPQCPMKGQSRTTLRLKQSGSLPPYCFPALPPPLATTLHTRLTISRIGPKEEGWNRLFAFAFSSGPPNAARLHWMAWQILLKQQHGINVASVLLDVAAKRAWLFWDDSVRVKMTWCGDGIEGYTWKRRAARVQLCVPLWSIICMYLVQAWKHWAGCFENTSKPLSY